MFTATQDPEHLISGQPGIPEPWRQELDSAVPRVSGCPRAVLLGLPCAHCKAYFAADLEVCPVCGGKERASTAKRASSAKTLLPPKENLSGPQSQKGESARASSTRTATSYEEDL